MRAREPPCFGFGTEKPTEESFGNRREPRIQTKLIGFSETAWTLGMMVH